jgi:hypothetical protein
MVEQIFLWCRDRKIIRPASSEIERIVRSERHRFLEGWLDRIAGRLSDETLRIMKPLYLIRTVHPGSDLRP